MTQEASHANLTLALNTTLEREFVSPLTSIRGALEILRDFPDLSGEQRERFLANALEDCKRLELGIEQLASTVYKAGDRQRTQEPAATPDDSDSEHAQRIRFFTDSQIVEIDFSDMEFSSSKLVNDFYNLLERMLEHSGQRWYIVVNYHNCSVWPEAWVAFAHRAKKINVGYSLGTVHYYDASKPDAESCHPYDPDLFSSRTAAMARIEELRSAAQGK
jgi:K+-sensing histidine kinase KdpD